MLASKSSGSSRSRSVPHPREDAQEDRDSVFSQANHLETC
jgi:hypothetical protein